MRLISSRSRIWFGLLAASLSASAAAQTLQVPSVPTGGALAVQASVSAFGVGPLGGVPIALTVPGRCGTFQGAETLEVTTDSSGMFRFTFNAGSVPGACTIVGRNGAVTGSVTTTIYRPSEVGIATNLMQVLRRVKVGTPVDFTFTVIANGVALYGVPIAFDVASSPGVVATLYGPPQGTDQAGGYKVTATGNNIAGVYDVIARVGNASRAFRVSQTVPPTLDTPGRSVHLENVASSLSSVVLSIVEGAPSCTITRALYLPESWITSLAPQGMSGFPFGGVQLEVYCPNQTVKLRLDYPEPIPADANLLVNAPVPWSSAPWNAIPATISGNSITFSLTDGGIGDRVMTGNLQTVFALGKPGERVAPGPIPAVKGLWWVGPQENGWGMSIAQNDQGNIFGAIYAYDETGRATWWTVPGGMWNDARTRFDGELFAPYGTPWYAYDPLLTETAGSDGPIRFSFADTGNVTIDYAVKGVPGRKSLQPQVFGPPATSPVTGVGGMWWGTVNLSGWGVAIIQQNATLFSVWYTYDATNRPTWFVMPGGAWTSATTYEGRIYKTRGSPWSGKPYDPAQLQVTDVGPYRLTFSSNNTAASLDYTVEGMSGRLSMVRQNGF